MPYKTNVAQRLIIKHRGVSTEGFPMCWWYLYQVGCAALAGWLVHWILPGPAVTGTDARMLAVGAALLGTLAANGLSWRWEASLFSGTGSLIG